MVASSAVLERAEALEKNPPETDITVRSLTAVSRGFAYACRPGLVHFFEKVSNDKYKKRNIYEIKDKDFRKEQKDFINSVLHLAVNTTETEMIATCRRSQLFSIKLWGPEMDIVS